MSREVLLTLLLVVLAAVACALVVRRVEEASASAVTAASVPSPFERDETQAFLGKAKAAEAIADPLQRCIAYPDPPGSHWSPQLTRAYCVYLRQTLPDPAEIARLVRNGHAEDVDRMLDRIVEAQRTDPGQQGMLDRVYHSAFEDSSTATREMVDEWLRQAPDSAFAHAASGVAWVAAAQDARGTKFVQSTSDDQLDAMHEDLEKARVELEKAVTIDPRLTPAYAEMIYADGLEGNGSGAKAAMQQGLGVDPANYAIYKQALWRAEPKWGGSVEEMRKVVDRMRPNIARNPLLALLVAEPDVVDAGIDCGCHDRVQVEAYRRVFDTPTRASVLGSAGVSASKGGQPAIAAVYLSEALRFTPDLLDERFYRVKALIALGKVPWAEAEADRLVADAPKYEFGPVARAEAAKAAGHWEKAASAFREVVDRKPDDAWALTELGLAYVQHTHEWDKGWEIADRMIRLYPEDGTGWAIRAIIQKDQPRPGLHETLVYFIDHFGNDPHFKVTADEMRADLAREKQAASPARSP